MLEVSSFRVVILDRCRCLRSPASNHPQTEISGPHKPDNKEVGEEQTVYNFIREQVLKSEYGSSS